MIDVQIVGYGFQSGSGGQRVGQGVIQSGDSLRLVESAFLEYHDYQIFLVSHNVPAFPFIGRLEVVTGGIYMNSRSCLFQFVMDAFYSNPLLIELLKLLAFQNAVHGFLWSATRRKSLHFIAILYLMSTLYIFIIFATIPCDEGF